MSGDAQTAQPDRVECGLPAKEAAAEEDTLLRAGAGEGEGGGEAKKKGNLCSRGVRMDWLARGL